MKNKKISRSLKRFHKLKRVKKQIKTLLWILFAIAIVCQFRVDGVIAEESVENRSALPTAENKEMTTKEEVVAEIIKQARKYGVDEDRALNIADCESKLGYYKYNLQGSSAKGVFMFIDSTWANYCEGDVLDYKANIKCFMDIYPKHPSWWECNY